MAKYLIVGGVAGGATAAARLRRNDEKAEIILFEKGKYISYANCGLPYHIGGTIPKRESLLVQTPEAFNRRYVVDIRAESEVIAIDRTAQTVTVRHADGTTYTESYDKLLLSPGALPIRPQIEGIDSLGVFSLRNVDDMDQVKAYIHEHQVRHATIVGGGFIGLEMAENLHQLGIQIDLVELAPQVMAFMDYSMANLVHAELVHHGIGLKLGAGLEAIERHNEQLSLRLSTGQTLKSDLVLLSIGVIPNSRLAKESGLAIGAKGGIQVNEYLQTSDPNIYAVGDVIEYPHPLMEGAWHNYLAGPANRQARLVADNMQGGQERYEGSIGTAIAKIFDLSAGATGLPAKMLQRSGMPYLSATIHPYSHAGYYPGAHPMTLKITFDPTSGKLYGAQAVGHAGIDKRIDSIAQIIKQNGSIYDLMRTEQAYAPPYSSAKDPVAQVAYVAENIITDKMKPIYWREIANLSDDVQLIDVRTPAEHQLGSIPKSINIPVDDLRSHLNKLDLNKPIVVYCAVGMRGYTATRILTGHGATNVRNLIGGYKLWHSATANHSDQERTPSPKTNTPPPSNAHEERQELKVTRECIDASGQYCPGPIITLQRAIADINEGEQVEIIATDRGFLVDAEAWCQSTGHKLITSERNHDKYRVVVEKASSPTVSSSPSNANGKTLILFSDDLDKVLATFVLANGAAATGKKVSIFFTFWGLNAIKRGVSLNEGKDLWGKLFSWMLPKSSLKLGLSKMNFGGIGGRMMRHIMSKRNVLSLEKLREQAIEQGVEFIACQMSMDVMGIHKEELLEGVKIGGVATYIQRAEESNINLFV